MNTSELIRAISKKNNISQAMAKRLLHSHIENITQHIASSNRVIFKGFGSFSIKALKAKKTWIPSKQRFQNIAAKNAIKFTPAGKLKTEINEEGSHD